MNPVYIVGTARTPIGAFLGTLAPLTAPQLGAVAIRAALERAEIEPKHVNEVFMGNALTAGIGQAPARQAALAADLPASVPCTTVGKVCGSGMQAILLGCRSLLVGDADIVVAGGMESMSNVPYYLPGARQGMRLGHSQFRDGMITDGLWDAYDDVHMGTLAELCVRRFEIDRAEQDRYAAESYRRALIARDQGRFDGEIVNVEVPQRKGPALRVALDEEPSRGDVARLPDLRPAFEKNGSITAGNASSVNDGAAALALASERAIESRKLRPLARIIGYAQYAGEPKWYSTAPAQASKHVLHKLGLGLADIDLWEINEAFACVVLACMRLLPLDPSRINVNGGAVALGHPIGATGARLVVSLLAALQQRNLKRGLATVCIGGGEGLALVIERI
jgi:acetyl-CoA C-acetyltransferase